MLSCYLTEKNPTAIPIVLVNVEDFSHWFGQQTPQLKHWLSAQFKPQSGASIIVPDEHGKLSRVICCVAQESLWETGHLPFLLPEGDYYFEEVEESWYEKYAMGWGLGAYQFTRYKQPLRMPAQLFLPETIHPTIHHIVEAIYFVRNLINTPADDLGPTQFAEVAVELAHSYGAKVTQIVGENLLKENYGLIYAVGRGSDDHPRLFDMRWGDAQHPKLTLVGKGVCFDTGGLDLKGSSFMSLMKKDMAGGAHVLGLARMIMQEKLPIALRVLVPMVENAVSGNAYRPGDIIKSRSGLTVEVGNTDAEGRLVLADALTEAVSEQPELIIDLSTLTGAARVALGPDLPVLFSNQDEMAQSLIQTGQEESDPLWQLPLYAPYREWLNSNIADLNNNSSQPYAGAITAALFLKAFVPDDIPWMHVDMMAWNLCTRSGRPIGGEATTLRALFAWIKERF